MTDPRLSHFEGLFRHDADPWHYRTSSYEQAKYDATLAALSFARYASAIEAGCANGELGARVAQRCDRYLGLDCAAPAVELARRRLAHLPHARVRQCFLPHRWPSRRADLIVLSEILYYLTAKELDRLASALQHTLMPGGEMIIVNWTGETDTELCGRDATARLIRALGNWCRTTLSRRGPDYDLVLLRRPSRPAAREPRALNGP